jgi:hypothetical protein
MRTKTSGGEVDSVSLSGGLLLLKASCIEACDQCAEACEQGLATDDSYTSPGTEPYGQVHLALVSCASVCRLVSAALRDCPGLALDMVQWCAEVCVQCSGTANPDTVADDAWDRVVEACLACAGACESLLRPVRRSAREVLVACGSREDSDFQRRMAL